jgi:hypothetical protein
MQTTAYARRIVLRTGFMSGMELSFTGVARPRYPLETFTPAFTV